MKEYSNKKNYAYNLVTKLSFWPEKMKCTFILRNLKNIFKIFSLYLKILADNKSFCKEIFCYNYLFIAQNFRTCRKFLNFFYANYLLKGNKIEFLYNSFLLIFKTPNSLKGLKYSKLVLNIVR